MNKQARNHCYALTNGSLPPVTSKPVPWYEMKNLGNSEAEITIYDVIGGSFWSEGVTGKQFVEDLKNLPPHQTLNIFINSPGGAVYDGRLIYNALKRHKAYKKVTIDGLAASMASGVAMAGDEIIMPENAMMMIHDPSMCLCGNAREMRDAADYLDKSKKTLISAYRDKTGLDDSKISDLMTAETWMTADEALELGFADKIGNKIEVTALSRFDLSMFSKAPELVLHLPVEANRTRHEPPKGDTPVMEITLEKIKQDYASIAEALRAEGKQQAEGNLAEKIAQAKNEGAEQERKRIQEVEAQAMAGHEALIAELKFDGKTTGPEAAVKVLAAEKQKCSNHLQTLRNEAPKPVGPSLNDALPTSTVQETSEFSEEACKAQWEKDAKIRDEFKTFDVYKAYCKAEKSGQARIKNS